MHFPGKSVSHKKTSVYIVLLLSYVFILLLTLSSSIVYYFQINRQITAQTEISRQLLLTQLQTSVESTVAGIEKLCNEVAFDKSVHQYAKGLPGFTYKELKSVLSSRLYQGDVVYDYFVYVKSTDEIITPTIKMSSRQFYDIIYTFEDMSYEEFREQYLEPVHFQKYMPLQSLILYDEESILILPFVQSFPVAASGEPLGQVICFINARKLFENVNLIHQSTGSDVYILDENNNIIITSEDAAFLDASMADAASGKIEQGTVISKRTADTLGWKFIVRTPTVLSFTENRRFLQNSLLIFLIYLGIGLVMVCFLARRNYSPISEISSLIHNNPPEGLPLTGTNNEFDAIKGTLIHQFQRDKKLNSIINSQLPYVRRAMLDRMLKGLVTDYDQAIEHLKEMDMSFSTDSFLVVSLEIAETCPFLQFENAWDENLFLARMVVSNVGNELFEPHFENYYIDYEQQHCVFLLCPKKEQPMEELSEEIVLLTSKLHDFIQNEFQIECNIGISTLHHAPGSIPLCFDEACKASQYSRLAQAEGPVFFSDLLNLETNYYYPAEMEYQLISSLKAGHFDQAKAFIEKILQLNTHEKSLSPHALRGLLFEINSTLSKQLSSIHIAKGENPVAETGFNALSDPLSLETARAKYMEMIDQISYQKMTEPAVSKPEKLAASIASYITENAGSQWIDLNTLSEVFHVTPQYISNIFKKYQNENIKDYISRAKLEVAKELLLTTELSVNEIAQRLGYAGEIGVIRLFKKYEGITPGDFRNLHS